MKELFLIALFTCIFCDELHFFFYKNGKMSVDKTKEGLINGPIYVEFLPAFNISVVTGMYKSSQEHVPFGLESYITSIKWNKDRVDMKARCNEGAWGKETFEEMLGTISIQGTWDDIHVTGTCYDSEKRHSYSIDVQGMKTDCPLYSQKEASKRVEEIVGEPKDKYHPVHVLNFAVLGYPYIHSAYDCSWWLQNFENSTTPKSGYAVVGLDGAHCALIDSEGDKFIHSNPAKNKVTKTPMSMLSVFFPKGHIFKNYHC